jgi:N-acetyl-gamma-glutamyl-phosphate reductase
VDKKIKIGIVGGAGYTAGELLRILVNHPYAEIQFVHSTSNAGNLISDVHSDLLGETDVKFADTLKYADVIFLCLGHGLSADFFGKNNIDPKTKVIDLGNDFRVKPNYKDRTFIYGLPEVNRKFIVNAQNIANPGCFATAIQLGLLPLAEARLLHDEVHVNAITGSTGAGRSLSETGHFSYRNNNISIYKPFTHQHMAEMSRTLNGLQKEESVNINFIPVRGNFTRGIFTTIYTKSDLSKEEANELYSKYYNGHPYTIISKKEISLKEVVNTNKCFLHIDKIENKLLVTSSIDNLIKGASGQAIQNMNLMFGIDETSGLKLKPIGF